MPRKSTINAHEVAKYCFEPRSIADICSKFQINLSQAHRVMTKLTWGKVVATRMESGNGAQRKIFLLTELEQENNWGRPNPLRSALPAHDPFGLTKRSAELNT